MEIEIPETIRRKIGDRAGMPDTVGMSGSKVICFDDMVLKIEEECAESENERRMMAWLSGKLPVPRVLCSETKEGISYLLMSRAEGAMSCSAEYLEHPGALAKALAGGLRMLWGLDASQCPSHNAVADKLRLAERLVEGNRCDVQNVEPETYGVNGFKSPAHLLEWLRKHQPEEDLVFSHGDFCLPNIFLNRGRLSGFIDLGRSGIADRYQDLALCYRSLRDNLAGRYGGKVYDGFRAESIFDELELEPDWNKIRYFLLLDELF